MGLHTLNATLTVRTTPEGLRHNADEDYHAWIVASRYDPDSIIVRDTLGRRNGGFTLWFRMRCNNGDCDAHFYVREDDLEFAASRFFPVPDDQDLAAARAAGASSA